MASTHRIEGDPGGLSGRSGGAGLRTVVALATALTACSGREDGSVVYDRTRVVEIQIEMPAADWDALRNQRPPNAGPMATTGHGPGCLPHNNPGFAYSTYEARVVIDGTTLERVGIRKRAWCGSESTEKPSLRLDFDEYAPDRELDGVEGLTLNNSIQDPSFIRQCLAYHVFAAAGLPASRCNFARVAVNGMPSELYVNVEPVKKLYLKREFPGDDGKGNAYKGFLADFSSDLVQYFDKERNEDDPDRSDLDVVVAALAVDDTTLEASLGAVIDLDSYFAHWAVEVLLAHTDGYAGNTNNFIVYHANDGRFRFLPWGVDTTFGTFGRPLGLSRALVPSRLCGIDKTAADYTAAMRDVLAGAWDEPALQAEIDRLATLIEAGDNGELDKVREFVDGRRTAIEEVLAGTLPCESNGGPGGEPGGTGTLDASFSTTFGSLERDPVTTGTATVELSLDGTASTVTLAGAVAGTGQLRLAARLEDGATIMILVDLPQTPAVDVATQVNGIVLKSEANGAPMPLGGLAATLTLTTSGATDGATVAGSLGGSF